MGRVCATVTDKVRMPFIDGMGDDDEGLVCLELTSTVDNNGSS